MYEGYLSLGGTEIINEQRTAAYVRALAPGLGLTDDCCSCDSINAVLGEGTYTTPTADEPSWFSAFRQESAEFLGLLPLAFRGFDDSTRQVTFTEGISDGAVAGRPRMSGRTLSVSALMVATTQKGLDYGMSWLRDALAGSECTDGMCAGDDLCFLAHCPDLCSDPMTESILDLDYSEGTPLNAVVWQNPTGLEPTISDGRLVWEPVPPAWSTSVALDGLTPGATYRVDVSLPLLTSLPPGSSAEVYIAGLDAGTKVWGIPFKGDGPDSSGAVFEFIAAHSTHRLVIEPDFPASSLPRLEVESVSVVRVARPTIVLTTWPLPSSPGEQYAWGFGPAVANAAQAWSAPHDFRWQATAAFTAAAGALSARRVLTGLTPGRRYRVRTYVRVGKFGVAGPLLVSVSAGGSTTIATHGWVTHEFVATSPSTTVAVGNGDSIVAADVNDAFTVSPYYLRLEEVVEDPIEPVVEVGTSLRTYREAVVTSGPAVMEVYPSLRGYSMQRVEWTIGVGVPRPVAPAILITDSLGPGGVVVPDVDCVNGQQTVTNMLTNPSFETNTTGWSTSVTGTGTVSLTNPTTSFASGGVKVGQLTFTGTIPSSAYLNSAALTLVQRQQYTFSLDVRSNYRAEVSLVARSDNSAWEYETPSFLVVPNAPMSRRSITFSPAPYVNGPWRVAVRVRGSSALSGSVPVTGQYIQVDRLMLTARASDGVYVDGSVPGGVWNGTANGSTSTWTNPVPSIVVDPDCPPPPSPPRPPVVINDCALPASSWLRHVIEVPARATQQAVVAYPTVTLTTGSSDARGVRVRLVANPNGWDPGMLDQCDYCGEFVLVYLPANAALTVDANTRRVTVVTAAGETSGRHLLSGSDGGPVTWPEMTCGMPYVLLVDLDTTNDPLVNLSVSITPAY